MQLFHEKRLKPTFKKIIVFFVKFTWFFISFGAIVEGPKSHRLQTPALNMPCTHTQKTRRWQHHALEMLLFSVGMTVRVDG